MVAYGVHAISDDNDEDFEAEPKKKPKICVGGAIKRKRRRHGKPKVCKAETETATAKRQKEVEEVKAYQEKLEERVSSLEATLLMASAWQRGVELKERERASVRGKVSQFEKTNEGVVEKFLQVNVQQHLSARVETGRRRSPTSIPHNDAGIKRIKNGSRGDEKESELEDLLLNFEPGEIEEDILEMADEDVSKLLDEDNTFS